MPGNLCVLCGKQDKIRNLVAPCDCHKKDDGALCHASCLKQRISEHAQSELDHESDNALLCAYCGKPYRVRLSWRFTNQRFWSTTSLHMYFQFAFMILSVIGFTASAFLVLGTKHSQSGEPPPLLLIVCMVLLVLASTVLAVWKVYGRWKRHQLEPATLEIV